MSLTASAVLLLAKRSAKKHGIDREQAMAWARNQEAKIRQQAGLRGRQAIGLETGYGDYEAGYLEALQSAGLMDTNPPVSGLGLIDRFRAKRADRLDESAEQKMARALELRRRAGIAGVGDPASEAIANIQAHKLDVATRNTELERALKLPMSFAVIAMQSVADNGAWSTAGSGFLTPQDMDCVSIVADTAAQGSQISVFTVNGQSLISGTVSASNYIPGNFSRDGFPFKCFLPRATLIVVTGVNISGGESNAGLYLNGYVSPTTIVNR